MDFEYALEAAGALPSCGLNERPVAFPVPAGRRRDSDLCAGGVPDRERSAQADQ